MESAPILMKKAALCADFGSTMAPAAPSGVRHGDSGLETNPDQRGSWASTVTLSETSVVPALTAGATFAEARSAFIMGAA